MMQITELEVWKAAIELAKQCYEMTDRFSEKEQFGLSYQIKRTVTNIPANVSAAASRKHGKESLRHLFRARDLIYEVESHIYLSNKLGYISEEELESMLELLNSSKRLLFGFIKYYKRSSYPDGGRRGRTPQSHQDTSEDVSDDDMDDDDF